MKWLKPVKCCCYWVTLVLTWACLCVTECDVPVPACQWVRTRKAACVGLAICPGWDMKPSVIMSLAVGWAVSGAAAPLPALALISQQGEHDSSSGVTNQLLVWASDQPSHLFMEPKHLGLLTESGQSFMIFTFVTKTDGRKKPFSELSKHYAVRTLLLLRG